MLKEQIINILDKHPASSPNAPDISSSSHDSCNKFVWTTDSVVRVVGYSRSTVGSYCFAYNGVIYPLGSNDARLMTHTVNEHRSTNKPTNVAPHYRCVSRRLEIPKYLKCNSFNLKNARSTGHGYVTLNHGTKQNKYKSLDVEEVRHEKLQWGTSQPHFPTAMLKLSDKLLGVATSR